jgi:hypothetical protein
MTEKESATSRVEKMLGEKRAWDWEDGYHWACKGIHPRSDIHADSSVISDRAFEKSKVVKKQILDIVRDLEAQASMVLEQEP